jgi:hypothetical protein
VKLTGTQSTLSCLTSWIFSNSRQACNSVLLANYKKLPVGLSCEAVGVKSRLCCPLASISLMHFTYTFYEMDFDLRQSRDQCT